MSSPLREDARRMNPQATPESTAKSFRLSPAVVPPSTVLFRAGISTHFARQVKGIAL